MQRDQRVRDFNIDLALLVGLNIAELSGVAATLGVGGGPVLASIDVEVWAGRGAAVGVVAKLVNVEPVLTGCQPADLSGHSDWTITLNIIRNKTSNVITCYLLRNLKQQHNIIQYILKLNDINKVVKKRRHNRDDSQENHIPLEEVI